MQNHDFRASGECTSSGSPKDSCLMCGRTEKAHAVEVEKEQRIKILWGGKFYEFSNWQEALGRGFHLG